MSSRNQASTPDLFAAVVLATGTEVSRDMAHGQQTVTGVDIDSATFDVEAIFCYLCDVLC